MLTRLSFYDILYESNCYEPNQLDVIYKNVNHVLKDKVKPLTKDMIKGLANKSDVEVEHIGILLNGEIYELFSQNEEIIKLIKNNN